MEILIIDDEEIIRDTLHDFFEFMGHMTTCIDNGLEGLQEIRNHNYDAAFVDIRMPGINGIDFLNRMKATNTAKSVPVFIMTGHGDEETRCEAMSSGASGFLCKPFGYNEIKKIVDGITKSAEKK